MTSLVANLLTIPVGKVNFKRILSTMSVGPENDRSNLMKLQELTKELPTLDELVVSANEDTIDYEVGSGRYTGYHVYHDELLAIMRAHLEPDTVMNAHVHPDINEWMGVMEGHIDVYLDGGECVRVNKGEAIHIKPGQKHSIATSVDTWVWSISMPPSEGYPHVAARRKN